MNIYLVGGAVRDRLLGIPVKDRDWLVVGGSEAEMLERGFVRADGQFPVFLHPETGEEYALARRETKTGPGYKGFSVEYGPDVTLEEDLRRRDFTINALVENEADEVIDPVGGLADIEQRRLRHITPAFGEDPVRLLRAARFIARLSTHDFSLAHDTFDLMKQMATSEELAALKPERVWQELKRALLEPAPWRFFETLQRCGALAALLPPLAEAMAESEESDTAHGEQPDCEPIRALKRAVAAGADPQVRFAALLHSLCLGTARASWLKAALPVEREYLDLLAQLQGVARFYPGALHREPAATLDLLIRGRAQQQPERFHRLLLLCTVVWPAPPEQLTAWLAEAGRAMASISPARLSAEGLQGADLGRVLRERQIRAISGLGT
ncbi:rhodanese [Sedimenticola hydrogenitrophicus]|uniref:rhodanese n=1 Tax=Sedimenticola hydrogenitrophicus TaxID=2967975 RepID=UPI0021A8858A|nr:rhodanese [Sedimenticola hydrogenitrophicus]